ncbi:hypothetical protein PV327_011192, partial [Microctonus hyperodae]
MRHHSSDVHGLCLQHITHYCCDDAYRDHARPVKAAHLSEVVRPCNRNVQYSGKKVKQQHVILNLGNVIQINIEKLFEISPSVTSCFIKVCIKKSRHNKNPKEWESNQHTRICSAHFINNSKSDNSHFLFQEKSKDHKMGD